MEPFKPFQTRMPDPEFVIIEMYGGHNNLSAFVYEDLQEVAAGIKGSKMALIGLAAISNKPACVVEVTPTNGIQLIENLGQIDTGDPDTLHNFLVRSLITYPKARKAIGFWDHGTGVFDETDNSEKILSRQINSVAREDRSRSRPARHLFFPKARTVEDIETRGMLHDDTTGGVLTNLEAGAMLNAAFKDKGTRGVVLRINSPGGSPVQAGQIFAEMRRLREKYPQIPLHAVVEEMAASGGYYVAVGADRIYVDKASLVGSIGVIIDSFGLVGTMDKVGVERRVITAGENKAFLDPFSPLPDKQRAYAEAMIEEIHQQFIQAVRDGRGARLKETPDLYSGLVWNGQRAVELGLADGYGTVASVARDVFHAEEIVDFTPREDLANRIARRLGTEAGKFTLKALRSAAFAMPALR